MPPNIETQWVDNYNSLFGRAGTITWDGRSLPRYTVPMISPHMAGLDGPGTQIQLLVVGHSLYSQIVGLVHEDIVPQEDVNSVGYVVKLSKEGSDIYTKYHAHVSRPDGWVEAPKPQHQAPIIQGRILRP